MTNNNKSKPVKEYFNFNTENGRKTIVVTSIFVGLLGGYVIGHYGNENIAGNVATYNGGKVTRNDLYNKLKNNTTGSGIVKSTIILDIFDKEFGSEISDDIIKSAVNYYEQIGYESSNSSKEREETTRKQLAFEKGLKENLTASDKEMKQAFESYRQPVSFSFVGFTDKSKADKVLEQVNQGKKMKSLSNDSSIGTGDKITYTNAYNYSYQDYTNVLPEKAINTLYEMKSGDTKEVEYQLVNNSGEKQTCYYVLKVYDTNEKSDNWKDYKSDLSNLVKTNKMNNDKEAVNKAISKEFKKYDVKIQDNYIAKALSDYME